MYFWIFIISGLLFVTTVRALVYRKSGEKITREPRHRCITSSLSPSMAVPVACRCEHCSPFPCEIVVIAARSINCWPPSFYELFAIHIFLHISLPPRVHWRQFAAAILSVPLFREGQQPARARRPIGHISNVRLAATVQRGLYDGIIDGAARNERQ